MSEQNKSNKEYEAVLEIIQGCKMDKGDYYERAANHRLVYDYINSIKETAPGKAAGLELMILEGVPKDNTILKEMERLKKIIMDNMKKEGNGRRENTNG
jgi:hypothetical protein